MRIRAVVLGVVFSLALPIAGAYARAITNGPEYQSGAGFMLYSGVEDTGMEVARHHKKSSNVSQKPPKSNKSNKPKKSKSNKSKKSSKSPSR